MKKINSKENIDINKIKVTSAEIIVSGNADKPYYVIKYYPCNDEECYIGYGSYNLSFVFNWLDECFEIVQNNGIGILNYGNEEENINLNIPPRKKTKVGNVKIVEGRRRKKSYYSDLTERD